MLYTASLVLAFAITLFLVSKIAKMMHAKRPDIGWVLLAMIVGMIFAAGALAALKLLVQDLDPIVMLIISLLTVLIASSAAFKIINKMSWSGAITTNIANVMIGLITGVLAVVINGESIQETVDKVSSTARNSNDIVAVINSDQGAINEQVDESQIEAELAQDEMSMDDQEAALDEDAEPVIREIDLIPPSAAKQILANKNKVYKEPKFHVITLGDIQTAVGYKIRIKKKNGTTIVGSLKRISGNDAVISRRLASGEAITPIAKASIRQLEVYR